jgi:hypothetical protein
MMAGDTAGRERPQVPKALAALNCLGNTGLLFVRHVRPIRVRRLPSEGAGPCFPEGGLLG